MAILDHRLGSHDAVIVGGGCGVCARSPKMSDVNDTNHCPHRPCFVPCVPRRAYPETNLTNMSPSQIPPPSWMEINCQANMVIIVDGCAHEFKAAGPDREAAVRRDAINDDDLSLQYWRHYNAPKSDTCAC